MPKPMKSRKTLFLAAVRLGETTVERFAAEAPNSTGRQGVSTAFLYDVLNGKSTSAPLTEHVDEFIREQFGAVREQLAEIAA